MLFGQPFPARESVSVSRSRGCARENDAPDRSSCAALTQAHYVSPKTVFRELINRRRLGGHDPLHHVADRENAHDLAASSTAGAHSFSVSRIAAADRVVVKR